MLAGQQIEAQLFHLGAEVARVGVDLVAQIGGRLEQLNGLERGRADGGGQGVGEEVGAAALAQQIHDGLARGGVAAGGAAHGLAEGAGDDVDPAHDAAVFGGAAAMLTHKAHGVAVVHHGQRVKLLGQVADALEICDIPVHREHAVGGDEDLFAAKGARFLELGAQILHVVVFIAEALCLAKPHAVDDRGMVELV